MSTTRSRIRRRRWTYDAMRRWVRYRVLIPVFRSPHSAEHTARGVASGIFWGLTPSVGVQTIAILSTWFVGRRLFGKDSSLLQACIWVSINNPLTMIPMYYAFYITGLWLMGNAQPSTGYAGFVDLWEQSAKSGWIHRMGAIVGAFGMPIVIGCIPYAAIGTTLSYRWALRLVRCRKERLHRAASLSHDPAPRARRG